MAWKQNTKPNSLFYSKGWFVYTYRLHILVNNVARSKVGFPSWLHKNQFGVQDPIVCVTQESFERSFLTVVQKLASNTHEVVHKAFQKPSCFWRTSPLHLSQVRKRHFCRRILSTELLPAPRRGQSHCWPPDPENPRKLERRPIDFERNLFGPFS